MSEKDKQEKQIDLNQTVTMKDVLALLQAQAEQQAAQAEKNDERLAKLIQEIHKPTELEQRELDKIKKELEDRQKERLENRDEELRKIEAKRIRQRTCLHQRRDGTSRAVYVRNGNFFVCQDPDCNAVIFPGPEPAKEQRVPYAIYDTEQFTRLMQTATRTDL